MSFLPQGPLSLEQFVDIRPELPDSGQWAELHNGEVALFEAPDSDHGLVVSHLTRKLSPLAADGTGTPVFRPALRISAEPLTLRVPAVAFYPSVGRFDLMEADAIDEVPAWVIEIASTADRRRAMSDRVDAYQQWGIGLIWLIDPRERQLVVIDGSDRTQHGETAQVSAAPVADLKFSLADLFQEPEWWGNRPG